MIGKLVKFEDVEKNEELGMCQYIGIRKSEALTRTSRITNFYLVFRAGKEVKREYSFHFSFEDINTIPKNFLFFYEIGSFVYYYTRYRPANPEIIEEQLKYSLIDQKIFEKKDVFPLNNLPVTVLPHVFAHFFISELAQIVTVCKKWKNSINHNRQWFIFFIFKRNL